MANDELSKKVYVRELKKALNLTQLTGDETSLDRWIIAPDVNRPGIELAGYIKGNDLKRVNLFGNKEAEYLKTLSPDVQRERIHTITDVYTPCIIVSSDEECPEILKEIAASKNFPLFRFQGKTYQAIVEIVSFLSENLAQSETIHAELLNIYGNGVLIMGESGIGKSEVALDLIKRGHMLVADDRVDIISIHNRIFGTSPDMLKGMIEVRGLGIVDVSMLFGAQTQLDRCEVNLVIRLEPYSQNDFNRVEPEAEKINLMGIEIPLIRLPMSEARPMSSIIEATVSDYILKKKGVNSTAIFVGRVFEEIEKNKESK